MTGNSLPYGGQKTCPVSGDQLGSRGPAVPVVTPQGATVYVCCPQCAAAVREHPETYLAKVVADRGLQ